MAIMTPNRRDDQAGGSPASDLASRELSVAAVENQFVESTYDKLAKGYDWFFGPTLHPGFSRRECMARHKSSIGLLPGAMNIGSGCRCINILSTSFMSARIQKREPSTRSFLI